MEIRAFKVSLLASALLLAVAALLLAGPLSAPAWAQDDGRQGEEESQNEEANNDGDAPLIDQSEEGQSDEQYNSAAIDCSQILQIIGGDQYANATNNGDGGDDEGDSAAANNQEFTAEQIQECIAIAGNDNNAENGSDDDNGDDGDDNGNGDDEEEHRAATDEDRENVVNEVDRDSALPKTGGMSLFTLAALAGGAVLLVVGGVALLVYGLVNRGPGRL